MSYTVRRLTQPDGSETAELVRADGTAAFSVEFAIDPQAAGTLCSPKWEAQLADGRATVDEQAKRITFAPDGDTPQQVFTARTEFDLPDLRDLRDQAATELATVTGWTAARTRGFVLWLWKWLPRIYRIQKALRRIE